MRVYRQHAHRHPPRNDYPEEQTHNSRGLHRAGTATPYLLQRACLVLSPDAVAVRASFRPVHSAMHGRNQGISFWTSRARLARTGRALAQAPEAQSFPATQARATSPRNGVLADARTRRARRLRCRSHRPCRIVLGGANNSRVPDGTDTSPCSMRMESVRARGFLARFFLAESQAFLPAVRQVLRCTDEHLDQVIVQTVVKLALKSPLKLWMVQVARV